MGSLKAFDRPEQTIGFAEAAIHELIAEWQAFGADDPFQTVTETDDDGVRIVKIVMTRDLPPILQRRATEALNNLKNAFDQMLFAVCSAIGRPIKQGHYPWADSPTGLAQIRAKNSHAERKRVFPPEVWTEIERQAPYKRGEGYAGGNDLVREMARLANAKHTVGLAVAGRFKAVSQNIKIGRVSGHGSFFASHFPVWDPVKKEAILERSKGAEGLECQYSTAFYVVFDEPIPALDAPSALEAFLGKAKGCFKGFKELAIRLGAA